MNFVKGLFLLLAIILVSCDNTGESKAIGKAKDRSDLEFSKAKSSKEYADLILKAITTNRGKVVAEQVIGGQNIDPDDIQKTVSSFGQAIGRMGWDKEGKENKIDEKRDNISYSWYDKRNRETVKISMVIQKGTRTYRLQNINFESRIEALESQKYPKKVAAQKEG